MSVLRLDFGEDAQRSALFFPFRLACKPSGWMFSSLGLMFLECVRLDPAGMPQGDYVGSWGR